MSNRSESARRRRRYLGYPLEAAFLYVIYGIFMVLPLDTASALGGWIGRDHRPAPAHVAQGPAQPGTRHAGTLRGAQGGDHNRHVGQSGPGHGGIPAPGRDLDADGNDRRRDRPRNRRHQNADAVLFRPYRQLGSRPAGRRPPRLARHGGLSPAQQSGHKLADQPGALGHRQPYGAQGPRRRAGSRGDPARTGGPSA